MFEFRLDKNFCQELKVFLDGFLLKFQGGLDTNTMDICETKRIAKIKQQLLKDKAHFM